ncbi:MAG: DUF6531 domain-containing protein [Candidatus Thiodiazotropha lotti]|nr:DUF6531 domain-containing protein [Candidatus Thiodiazotropha lotti]MCG8004614.1 DUF6531 domain-containing protein [Candidatus Thiodiazotropha lotti]MCG8006632.1 DUF6531 domain-containing protein [Candidatus Thiodiazotropha lotti]MCW4188241.1 DUF6531 domain-containing protein [Candidatus Thiodiazotropha lotti]MCW4194214.1 DUF6531 domain-containing protein [Candidatus Thiodiazotropha lotti]
MRNQTFYHSVIAGFFTVSLSFYTNTIHADEPIRWQAYPSSENEIFNTQAEAVNDFQSIGGDYAYVTEVTSITETKDLKEVKYKIPDAYPYVGPWIYTMNNSHGCSATESIDELLDCHYERNIEHLTGPLVNFAVCPPIYELDRASGVWTDFQTQTIPRAIDVDNWGYAYYDTRIYKYNETQGCYVSPGNTNNYRSREVKCLYPTTSFYSGEGLCKNARTAKVIATPNYYSTFKPTNCPEEGNPCSPASGNKFETETDYSSTDGSLKVERYYSSQGIGDGFDQLGPQWRHNYARRIDGYQAPAYTAYQGIKSPLYTTPREACYDGWDAIRSEAYGGLLSDATAYYRYGACEIRSAGIYVAKLIIHNTLNSAKDSGTSTQIHSINSGQGQANTYRYLGGSWQPLFNNQTTFTQTQAGWSLTLKNNTAEQYDSEGKLNSSTNSNGQTTLFTYDEDGHLHRVIGYFGDTLTYSYDATGRLASINTPDGDLNYGYDAENRLISVTYPDNRTRQYHYEDSRFPNHLTGITDENGDRYATWAYDAEGRAILSKHAGNAERIEFTYNPDGTTTVTDAAGAERIYHFTVQQGRMKVDHIEGDRCTTCSSGDIQAYTYDSNGFIASKTDWNGNITTYTRDVQGRELSRTEASGTPQARIITTTWDATLNKPLTVTEPEQLTEYTYDTEGRLLSRQQSPIQ